jgi:putative aminopeptidase FrvX
MACNAEKSYFFTLAEQLQTKWDIRFKKLLTDIRVSSARIASATDIDSVDMVSLQEKCNFNKMLHRITAKALGQVLVYVEQRLPPLSHSTPPKTHLS